VCGGGFRQIDNRAGKAPEMQTEKLNNIQHLLAIGTAAALIVSCINLTVYWYAFGINIFDYLSISEILTRSVFPIMLTSGVFIGILTTKIDIDPEEKKEQESNYFKKYKPQLYAFIFFILISAFGIYLGEFKSLSAVTMATAILLFTAEKSRNLIDFLNEISDIPKSLIIAMVLIILVSASNSAGSAINIKAGTIYQEADIKTKSKRIRGSYLGRTESRIFVWIRDEKSVLIVNQEEVKSIELKMKINLKIKKEQTESLSQEEAQKY
jgi:hypothetical protein